MTDSEQAKLYACELTKDRTWFDGNDERIAITAFLAGFAASEARAQVLVDVLQSINVQAIVNGQAGQVEVIEQIHAALARWREGEK